ncbi:hypothetical protein [Aliterella atlantica]|nr:hypothetical protein [Aliterella atlantica]
MQLNFQSQPINLSNRHQTGSDRPLSLAYDRSHYTATLPIFFS